MPSEPTAADRSNGPFFSGPDAPKESELYKCVHCGFCLQACPTYLETGLETESPRGRIALMKAVNERRIGITAETVRHWDLCIQCRACEVACPSGVPYGTLIEATMAQVEKHRKRGLLEKAATYIVLKQVVPKQSRLGLAVVGLRMYQRTGAQSLVRRTKVLSAIAPGLAALEGTAPEVPAERLEAKGQVIPAIGPLRARIAVLAGCVMPLVHGPQMNAAIRVLTRNGCEVQVTRGQGCCGAIHSHTGDLEQARDMARRNIDAFLSAGVDAVVVASAGCGSRMKEYGHLLADDSGYAEKARAFYDLVKDIHEFLAALPLIPPTGRIERKVTYQDSCHLANPQRVTAAPRALLRAIPGLELVELGSSVCCGAGGTYTVTEHEMSMRVLDSRMEAVSKTGADVVATANPGCVMQLKLGADRSGLGVRVCYVTDLLDEAYAAEGK
ncbi:MAG: 4Fe-4S dicluster domain-containing protein [SAR202 cluster bacterium]|nr:4Fe-4S dicluster domain-containing protein [SAR202 cluster bacterium]